MISYYPSHYDDGCEFSTPLPAERQKKIAAFVASRGKIRLDELASVFEVSQPTLRKDLTVLEQQGLLKRTHGGALRTGAPGERDLMTRFVQNVEAKRAIGRLCCDLIEEGEAVFLDCGTTIHHFAQQLATRSAELTVLTNSPSIAERFGRRQRNNPHRPWRTSASQDRWHFRPARIGNHRALFDCDRVHWWQRDHGGGNHGRGFQ